MDKKKILSSVLAGIFIVWFLSVVTTDANPTMAEVGFVAIGLYEAFRLALEEALEDKKGFSLRKL